MPLVNRTFSQVIDFTRTSAATFVGEDGKIATTPASRNLLTFTQEFDNAAWTKTRVTVTANATTAPDGTLTADRITEDTSTNTHYANVAFTPNGASHVLSFYAKAGAGRDWVWVRTLASGPAEKRTYFNVANGTVGTTPSGVTAAISSVGDGWYRCVVITTATSTTIDAWGFGPAQADNTASYTGDGTSGVFIWGAQLEANTAATTYTRNVGGVFPPRFDYDPVTLAPRGLLIEEQRTNLLLRSEEFDNASWGVVQGTVTANAATAPSGTATADSYIPNTTVNQHRFDQTPVSSAGAQVFSVFARASGYRWISLRIGTTGRSFDLQTGTVGTTGTATGTITALAGGWYRCAIAVPSALANDVCRVNVEFTDSIGSTFAGDGTSGIFVWGAQLEAGAFATSYIPTVASQVTRAADVATITGANFSQWYNPSQGTFVVEFQTQQSGLVSSTIYALALDASGSKRIVYIGTGADQASTFDGATILSGSGDVTGPVAKVASAYDGSGRAIVSNGGTVAVGTLASYGASSALNIGNVGGGQGFGHIRSIRYYPSRLTNAQLQALTA